MIQDVESQPIDDAQLLAILRERAWHLVGLDGEPVQSDPDLPELLGLFPALAIVSEFKESRETGAPLTDRADVLRRLKLRTAELWAAASLDGPKENH